MVRTIVCGMLAAIAGLSGVADEPVADRAVPSQDTPDNVESGPEAPREGSPGGQGRIVVIGPNGERHEYRLNGPDGILSGEGLPERLEGQDVPPWNIVEGSPLDGTPRPMIGIACQPASRLLRSHLKLENTGVVVTGVSPALPAAKAGISEGDIIVSVSGKPVTNAEDLALQITESGGQEIEIDFIHQGDPRAVKVKPVKTSPSEVSLNQMWIGRVGPGMQFEDAADVERQISELIERLRSEDTQPVRPEIPGLKEEISRLRKRIDQLEKHLPADNNRAQGH